MRGVSFRTAQLLLDRPLANNRLLRKTTNPQVKICGFFVFTLAFVVYVFSMRNTQEVQKKRSAVTGRNLSPAHKAKISSSMRKHWNPPVTSGVSTDTAKLVDKLGVVIS